MSGVSDNHVARVGYWDTGFDWQQFQTLLEAMPDGVLAVDTRGTIVAYNAEAARLLAYPPNGLMGVTIEALLPPQNAVVHRAHRDAFNAHPHARPMGAGRNLVAQRADGSQVDVDISLSPLQVGNRRVVIAALRDVSERRETERRIRELNEQLEERVRERTAELTAANRRLEEFNYAVSHELRAPLRIVLGFADLLCRDSKSQSTEQLVEHAAHICEAAHRMSRIVGGLLAMAHLDHHPINRDEVNLNALAQGAVGDLREEGAELHVDFHIGPLPNALGDAVLLRQVFVNLLSNAVKYCGNSRNVAVTVRGRHEGNTVTCQVQDNGPGFDNVHAAAVFDPFKRLQHTDPVEGLGIGLALARRIIERHGGRIWAESSAGGGATFSFCLPAV